MTRFVAIDGEALGGDHGQRYALLCASDGEHLWNAAGLRTQPILDWLCDRQQPTLELVAYGLNYDVNHWLKDIPQAWLRELWQTGWIVWHDWRIEWTPSKKLEIRDLQSGRWATIQEVFGFFDCSFLDAIARFGLATPQIVEEGKRDRGTFRASDRKNLIAYCTQETRLLEQLMTGVAEAAENVSATPWPHNWVGAGALAGSLLRNSEIAAHHVHDQHLTDTTGLEAIMRAYHAARTELYQQGPITGVKTYDLRSAYPAAMLRLPSLHNAHLVPRRRYDAGVAHGLWQVSWTHIPGDIMPLPVRHGRSIYWPAAGEGIYHAIEVQAALAAGYPLKIQGGWELRTPNPIKPFQFIDQLYRQRQALEHAGDPSAQIIKKGLAAIYGKLAQGHARRGLPRWQSYYWAGELTARVRATMLPVLLSARRPVMVATDGLFAAHAPVRETPRLGGWKNGSLDWLFALQPGVYQGYADKREILRSAGFFSGDIDYRDLYEAWQRDGTDLTYVYPSTRFTGLGISLQRNNLRQWREWLTEKHRLHAHPHRKDPELDPATGAYILHPPARAPGPSEPYQRKERLLDSRDDTNEQGMDQPLKTRI